MGFSPPSPTKLPYENQPSFAKVSSIIVTAPAHRKNASLNVPMETGKRPIRDAIDQPMLDGIEVDVIDVSGKIILITYLMFPETPLPYPLLALSVLAGA